MHAVKFWRRAIVLFMSGSWLITISTATKAQEATEKAAVDTPVAEQAGAEQEVVALDEVIVTATRSGKALEKIPGAVSVISRKDLEQQMLIAEDPSQLLATFVPGFSPSRQKMTQFGESMRGRSPLILIDGIPQSTPLRPGMREGYVIDPAVIERIEVVSGASAVQGFGATGGIINYITRSTKNEGTLHQFDTKISTQFEDDDLTSKVGYSLGYQAGDFDALGYVGLIKRGMAYDGEGRRLGVDPIQGDTVDSVGGDLFLKLGREFGVQRVQLSYNRFELSGQGDYLAVAGDRDTALPTSSEPGSPLGDAPRNRVQTASLDYRHYDLAGGSLTAQLYKQDFAALYGATKDNVFQDPNIAPQGELVDQSELAADKWGARLTYVHAGLGLPGLEATTGFDWLEDVTDQGLKATGRTWVPPLQLRNAAPFAQLEYETGPLTLRGGLRHEYAQLKVDDYQTLAFYGGHDVEGGTLSFDKTVKNLGGIARLGGGWSTFLAYSEGFGLTDVGLILRAVKDPDQSVSRLVDLQPVLTENKEVGLAWRAARGSAALSYYDSRSDLGSTIKVVNGVGVVERKPVEVKGWELSGEAKFTEQWGIFGHYAITRGKTAAAPGQPLNVDLSARFQGPDKLVLGTDWTFLGQGQLRLQNTTLFSRNINPGQTGLQEDFDGYTLVDATARWKGRHGTLGLGIENLLDRQYIGYFSQTVALSLKDPDASYFAGRGRTLTLSWSQTF
jgi:iron complex outermembrane recepter protein